MTEKVDPTKSGNDQTPQGSIGGGSKDSNSTRLPTIPGNVVPPSTEIKEPNTQNISAVKNNLLGFFYALIVIFVNVFGVVLAILLYKGLTEDFVALIQLFIKSLVVLIILADLSGLVYWIIGTIYRNRAKQIAEKDIDLQAFQGYTKLMIFTDEQKKFIKFYSSFGKRKLENLKRVITITVTMVDSGNIHQIAKKELQYHLHNYTSSGVYRQSRDGLHIEVVEDLDALMVYAMQVAHEEKARTSREGSINLFLDVKKVRKDSDKWYWEHPYDEVLKNML